MDLDRVHGIAGILHRAYAPHILCQLVDVDCPMTLSVLVRAMEYRTIERIIDRTCLDTLRALVDYGLVTRDDRPRRSTYTVTPSGRILTAGLITQVDAWLSAHPEFSR